MASSTGIAIKRFLTPNLSAENKKNKNFSINSNPRSQCRRKITSLSKIQKKNALKFLDIYKQTSNEQSLKKNLTRNTWIIRQSKRLRFGKELVGMNWKGLGKLGRSTLKSYGNRHDTRVIYEIAIRAWILLRFDSKVLSWLMMCPNIVWHVRWVLWKL